MAEKIAKTS